MSWVLLVVAGLLEVAWASALPATDGLRRVAPTALFLVLLGLNLMVTAVHGGCGPHCPTPTPPPPGWAAARYST